MSVTLTLKELRKQPFHLLKAIAESIALEIDEGNGEKVELLEQVFEVIEETGVMT